MYDYLQFIKYEKFVFFKLFFGDSPPPSKKVSKIKGLFYIFWNIYIFSYIFYILLLYLWYIFLIIIKKE